MRFKQQRRSPARSFRNILITAAVIAFAGIAPSAFAGQWVQTGRVRIVDTETISPYYVFWNNTCQGGVTGPSGVYSYGDTGPEGYGSCPSDASTGWAANVDGQYGYCRPDLESLGSGMSCVDNLYTIIGQGQYQGLLPAACSTPGTYAISYRRQVDLIDWGNGSQPNDYYEDISEVSAEYYCQ